MAFPWGVEGYLHPSEGRALWELASAIPEGSCVVELGAYKGRSTICLAQSGRRVVTVDHFSGEPALPKVAGVYPDHRDGFYRRHFEQNLEAKLGADWRSRVFVYTGKTSDESLADAVWLAHGPIGLVFIDADHGYGAVRADFDCWARLLEPGAFVAFHDQGWRGPAAVIAQAIEGGEWESRRLVRDLRVLERVSGGRSGRAEQTKVGIA